MEGKIVVIALLFPVFLQAQSNCFSSRGIICGASKFIFDRRAGSVITGVNPHFHLSAPGEPYSSKVFAPVDTPLIKSDTSIHTVRILDRLSVAICDPLVIRDGISTIHDPTAPTIIVNNFLYHGNIDSINPDYVQSITILKDSAATSIYGPNGNRFIVIVLKPHYWVDKSEHIIYRKKKRPR